MTQLTFDEAEKLAGSHTDDPDRRSAKDGTLFRFMYGRGALYHGKFIEMASYGRLLGLYMAVTKQRKEKIDRVT